MDLSEHKHKDHRAAGDRGGKAKKARNLVAKRNGAQAGYTNWKGMIGHTTTSTRMAAQKRADRMQRALSAPEVSRQSLVSPAPTVVAVAGPAGVGKSTLVKGLVKYYTTEVVHDVVGPMTVVATRKRRITILEVAPDLASMIDAAKVADVVMLVVDSAFGLEMETFELLNVLYAHGMPRVCAVLTHMDGHGSMAQLRAARKRLKQRFAAAVDRRCKLFMAEWDGQSSYRRNDIHQLGRFLADAGARDTRWRRAHAHILADRMEDVTPAEDVRADPACDRRVALYGYLRGARCAAGSDTMQKFHLPGVGDFTATNVTALPDPAPLPALAGADGAPAAAEGTGTKARERERVLFAPMANVGRVQLAAGGDGKGMYVNMRKQATYHDEGDLTAAERLMHELQIGTNAKGARGAGAEVSMFGGRRKVAFDDDLDNVADSELGSSSTSEDDVSYGSEGAYDDSADDESEAGARPAAAARRAAVDERDRARALHSAHKGRGAFNEGAWLGVDGAADDDVGHHDQAFVFPSSDDDVMGLDALMALENGLDIDVEADSEQGAEEGLEEGLMVTNTNTTATANDDDGALGSDYSYDYVEYSDPEVEVAAEDVDAAVDSLTASARLAAANADLKQRVSALPLQQIVYGADFDLSADYEAQDPAMPALLRVISDVDASDEFRVAFDVMDAEDYEVLMEGRWATKIAGTRAAAAAAAAVTAEAGAEDHARQAFDAAINEAAYRMGISGVFDDEAAERAREAAQERTPAASEGLATRVRHEDVENLAGDGSALDLDRDRVALTEARNAAVDAALGSALRGKVGGLATGTYVRIEFEAVPAEFVEYFDGHYPLIAGAVNLGEDKDGLLHCRIKRHRWHRKLLKSFNPLIVSLGWRRFETAPIYSVQDTNGRRRMLKYTPEHMHCLATFRGPAAPAQSGVICFQTMQPSTQGFRVGATGVLLETLATSPVVKKLKLTGRPMRSEARTAFIKGMFNSTAEANRFIGAKVRTVSGIRGVLKKVAKEPAGVVRCTFEDKIAMSDIVFMRTWFPVTPRPYCVPVDNLLLPPQERAQGWAQGARTVGRLRQDLQLKLKVTVDNVYRPVERKTRRFITPNAQVPQWLQKALPFKHKIKVGPSKRQRKAYVEARKATLDKNERQEDAFLRQVATAANERARREVRNQAKQAAEAKAEAKAEAEAVAERRRAARANLHAAQSRIQGEIRRKHVK